ncbi:MAG TPA: hypothetical protein VI583_08275, partial [Cyclobacteriaceae bacterium]|nr:hypothetical protein [Cyclobacteriaceae bacterium]
MKILFLTTFEHLGGAGLAAHRLYRALKNHTSAELNLLTQFGRNYRKYDIGNIPAFVRIGFEKFMLRPKLANPKDVFKFETGKSGMDIDAGHPL